MRHIERLAGYSDEAILSELRDVAVRLGKRTLSMSDLEHARVSYATLKNRFGGLRQALRKAGLTSPDFHRDVTEAALLSELQRIWDIVLLKEGRRPYREDLTKYGSTYSYGPYYRRWHSWVRACEALMEWEDRQPTGTPAESAASANAHTVAIRSSRTKRRIPLRIRYLVMRRDRFRCVVCGKCPATTPGVELHVDHFIPESAGGRTEPENLRTLCQDCNLGKGDLQSD